MSKKVKAEKPIDTPVGGIFYTDGGCRGEGFGGWGFHGYIYSDQDPKKGSGCPTNYLLSTGYIEKSKVEDKQTIKEVKPLKYVDAYGSFNYPVTNNIAELAAATNGLDYAIQNDLKYATIITDSDMVVKGSTDWLTTWKNNNWIKTDGQPVANKQYWQALDNNLNILREKGTTVEFKWIKGHSTYLGNQLADNLATIGVLSSKEQNNKVQVSTQIAEGYWSTTVDKSPFISHRSVYFNTRAGATTAGEYFLGDHTKDDDLLAKRTPDGCFSYVKLSTPEPVIEIFRNKQTELATGLESMIIGRLDKLYSPDTYKAIMNYGGVCLYSPYNNKLDLHFIDKEPVSRELKPPRLSLRAIESLNVLKGILLSYQVSSDKNIIATTITDKIYEGLPSGEYKLKPEFVAGFTSFKVLINYKTTDSIAVSEIDLCLGVDLPDRNTLKKFEKLKPSVVVLTWMESDKMFRYASVLTTQEGIGIWAGMCSNSKFIF